MSGFDRRVVLASVLASLVVIIGSGGAQAGIVITDTTIMPVADPLSQFDFKLALQPGNSMIFGDSITLLNVPDFNPGATTPTKYVYLVGSTDFSSFLSIGTAANVDGTTAITLTFDVPLPVAFVNSSSSPSNLPIGDLFVTTTVNFPPPPGSPLSNPINYQSRTHTNDLTTLIFGSGSTTPAVVPEPASLALVLVGAGFASARLLARGRRRAALPG